jgi:choline dehydrogenase-like flavoprotein
MLIDARDLAPRHHFDADICIVGAGAAGIAMARRLAKNGVQTLLIESGGFTQDVRTQQLYDGPGDGTVLAKPSTYLHRTRLRYVGGTTNHWGGMCRPLDSLDFERRSWVPNSGWPINRSTLAPYYTEAAEVLQVDPFDLEADEARPSGPSKWFLPDEVFVTRNFHYSPPTRFREVYGDELVASDRIRLVTWANLVEIVLRPDGTAVDQLRLATLTKRESTVRARTFVLACGAVENARMLLLSNRVHSNGVGNGHDLVGRYFLEHPHVAFAGALVIDADPWRRDRNARRALEAFFSGDGKKNAVVCPSPATQRAHQLLNASLWVNVHERGRSRIERRIWGALRETAHLERADEEGIERTPDAAAPCGARLYLRSEMVPDPNNRIKLIDEVDELGLRRAHLTWNLGSTDLDGVQRMLALLAHELARQGLGRGRVGLDPDDPWRYCSGGSHHLGTTRMSASPTQGVVDTDCRVHGVKNLYVAGSSVYPTGGHANPTLTLVALAMRLAAHIGEQHPATS